MLRAGFLPLGATILLLTVIWQCLEILKDLPDKDQMTEALAEDAGRGTSFIFGHSGLILGESSLLRRYPVPLKTIKPQTIQAFLTAEDRNFYQHGPLSFPDIIRAVIANVLNQRREQGASTLTQQLSRNLFLSREKTFHRKIVEMALAFRLEEYLSKDQILELYLNKIYLGRGAYGIEAAAKLYFGKSVSSLTLSESALLAALPRAPSALALHRNLPGAMLRRDYILGQMYSLGFIGSGELNEAVKEIPKIIDAPPRVPGHLRWVSSRVKYEMKTRFANLNQRFDALAIHTGIDLKQSDQFATKLSRHMKKLNKGRDDKELFQVAHLCLNLSTMLISCLQGSVDFSKSQFNRVFQMKRQINAMMLPLVYGRILMEGKYSLATNLRGVGQTSLWDDLYYRRFDQVDGATRVLGERGVTGFLETLGFDVVSSKGLTDGTGVQSSPWTLAQAMLSIFSLSGFRGGGLISRIETQDQTRLFDYQKKDGRNVLSSDSAWVIRAFFRTVQTEQAKAYSGYFSVSENLHDAWFAGVRDKTLHVIWIGSEFGKSTLADSVTLGYEWWQRVIDDVLSGSALNPVSEDHLKYSGYRRFTDREGIGRIMPFRYFPR